MTNEQQRTGHYRAHNSETALTLTPAPARWVPDPAGSGSFLTRRLEHLSASLVTQDPPALGAIKLFLLGSYGPGGPSEHRDSSDS
jgi:hypothetical protein